MPRSYRCPNPASRPAAGRGAALPVEESRQPGGRDRPVCVVAQLGYLRPVRVTVQPDADPAPAAHVRRAEEPGWPGGGEFLLRSRQACTPQVRELVVVVAVGPQRHERLLAADKPGGHAVAEPL